MVYSRTWNANYEAVPADTDNVGDGANVIRNLKADIRERMEHDHYFPANGTDADMGEHKTVTLRVSASAPSNAANKGTLYGYNKANIVELYYKSSSNQVIQITSNGALAPQFPAGTKMLFYQDTAPTGWTIQTDLNDKLVFVTKGSDAGGQTGGGAHASGTWIQPNHSHSIPSHLHMWHYISGSYAYTCNSAGVPTERFWGNETKYQFGLDTSNEAFNSNGYTTSNGAANSGNNATANTWRPAAYCCIIASKD